ncbi:hypothetical protein VE03_10365 [Pseudogymnoascus sp. 23342-1-I1]|nr:hypothetical protein VE03_10365 [Pseudogymnoascus sp. 23342-1-I1]
MADAGGSNNGGHSSEEYSGVVKDADIAKGGKAGDMAIVISSGDNIKKDRARRKAKKEEEEKTRKKAKEGNKNT